MLLLNKLENEQFSSIKIDSDFYWNISSDESFELSVTPDPIVGSLSEDIAQLKRTIDEGAMVTYADFDRIASVLKFISERRAPTE